MGKGHCRRADYTYGSRPMARARQALGYRVGRHEAGRLMRETGVWVRYRRRHRVTTNSNHRQPVFDENRLQRDFAVTAPDQVYAGDITYVWTQEGWLYLAVVIDLYSRKVVGWSIGRRLHSRLVCDALTMALWNRRPVKGNSTTRIAARSTPAMPSGGCSRPMAWPAA